MPTRRGSTAAGAPARLLDINVLIALTWPQHVHHVLAQEWFAAVAERPFATCPTTEAGLLRLSTNPAVVGRPVRMADALTLLRDVRSLPGHRFLPDASSLADPVIDLGRAVVASQVTDLQLVNLAAAAGVPLATLDRSIVDALAPGDRVHVETIR